MGCSNPHPHSQVWSTSKLPTIPAKELNNLRDYALSAAATTNGPKGYLDKPCLLCEYVTYERTAKERIVVENEHFIALVPWWAYWPFEVLGKSRFRLGFISRSSQRSTSVTVQETHTLIVPFYTRRDPRIGRHYLLRYDPLRQSLLLLLCLRHGHPPTTPPAKAC